MLFDGWAGLMRVLVLGVGTYGALILVLRISGKRTLSKMNAFDLVVTVSLGSALATVMLSKSVALAEGVLALVLLVALQWMVAWAAVRSALFRRIIKAEPRLLYFEQRMLVGALHRERVAEDEILAAVRSSGHADLSEVWAVVLETDGSFSVLTKPSQAQTTLGGMGGSCNRP